MTAVQLMNGAGAGLVPDATVPQALSRPPLFSLRMLLGALVTVSVATAILLWCWATWNDHLEALEKARSDSRFLVRVVEQQARSSIFGALSLVNAAAHQIGRGTPTLSLDQAQIDELIETANSIPGVKALQIADKAGILLFSTDLHEVLGTLIDPETLVAHQVGTAPEVSAATILPDGSGYFTVSRALRLDGAVTSIILAKVDLAAFAGFTGSLKLNPTTRLGVMRNDAQLVELFPLGRAQSHQSFSNLALFTRYLPVSKEGTYNLESAVDGIERIVSYRAIDGFPLVAFVGLSRPQIVYDYWNKEFRSAAYLASALTAIGLLGIVMLLNLTREQRIRECAEALARDLTLAVEIADIGMFEYEIGTGATSWAGVLRKVFGFDDVTPPMLERMIDRIHPDDRPGETAALKATSSPAFINGDGFFRREFRIVREGEVRWILLQGRTLFTMETGSRQAERIIGVVRDVTNRYALVAKKDGILREVNHRVMNSLQVLCSILNLQARSIPDVPERKRFEEAALRVASLATVHGRLFRTQNLEKIEVGTYLTGLCQDLANSLLDSSRVSIEGRSSGSTLATTDQIMPLGLVVAELVNGAARYVTAQGGRGKVELRFDGRDDRARLTIATSTSDQGRSLARTPGGVPADWCDSFGATLAEMMIEQIGGTISTDVSAGSRVVVDFTWPTAA